MNSASIEIPYPINNEKYSTYDQPFYDAKIRNPDLTYAKFMMRRQYDYVLNGGTHASLGENVPDMHEKGLFNFNNYKKMVNFSETAKVAEFGCGSLRIGRFFIDYLPNGNYLGLDVEPNLIEIGKKMISDNISKKDPILLDTSESSIEFGEKFSADFVFSNSVAYHVHQDDLKEYFSNLRRLTQKSGAILIFDAKISDQAVRYNSGGWAWPLELYERLLSPLKFVKLHGQKPYQHAESCTVAHLEFRSTY